MATAGPKRIRDRIEDLSDQTHPAQEVLPTLPTTPEDLLTPGYLKRLAHPTGALAKAIAEKAAVCDKIRSEYEEALQQFRGI